MLFLMGFTELGSDEHTCNKNTSSYHFFFLKHIFLVRFGKKTDPYRVSSFAVCISPGRAPRAFSSVLISQNVSSTGHCIFLTHLRTQLNAQHSCRTRTMCPVFTESMDRMLSLFFPGDGGDRQQDLLALGVGQTGNHFVPLDIRRKHGKFSPTHITSSKCPLESPIGL